MTWRGIFLLNIIHNIPSVILLQTPKGAAECTQKQYYSYLNNTLNVHVLLADAVDINIAIWIETPRVSFLHIRKIFKRSLLCKNAFAECKVSLEVRQDIRHPYYSNRKW